MEPPVGPIPLTVYYCQNPICRKIRAPSGLPHVVLKGRLMPGSFVIVKCRHCRTWTSIEIPKSQVEQPIANPDGIANV